MLRKIPAKPKVAFLVTPVSTLMDADGFVATSRPRFPPMPEMMLASTLRGTHPDSQLTITNLRGMDADRVEPRKAIRYYDRHMEEVWIGAPFAAARAEIAQADVVCVSNNFTQNGGVAQAFLGYVREVNPEAVILVGGSDVGARYGKYLEWGADVAVLAEGESRLPAILDRLIRGDDLMDVPRLALSRDGKVTLTEKPAPGRYVRLGSYAKNADPWATNMNTAALPALDLVDMSQFSESGEGLLIPGVSAPIMHFESSRGCHECCTFCATPNLVGDDFRFAQPRRVREILEFYVANGVRSIALNEDNLLSRVAQDPENGTRDVVAMFHHMRELGLAWEFDGGIQIGLLWDNQAGGIRRELFDAMFYNNRGEGGTWVGCYRIYVPLERLDDSDIKKLRKLQPFHIEMELMAEIVRVGIPALYLGIIVGVPTDTDATFNMTRQRCQEIRQEVARLNREKGDAAHTYTWYSFFNEILIPGSVDWVRFGDRLAFSADENPELWNFHTSVLRRKDGKSPLYFHDRRLELSTEFNGEAAIQRFRELGRYQPSDGRLLLKPDSGVADPYHLQGAVA